MLVTTLSLLLNSEVWKYYFCIYSCQNVAFSHTLSQCRGPEPLEGRGPDPVGEGSAHRQSVHGGFSFISVSCQRSSAPKLGQFFGRNFGDSGLVVPEVFVVDVFSVAGRWPPRWLYGCHAAEAGPGAPAPATFCAPHQGLWVTHSTFSVSSLSVLESTQFSDTKKGD